MGLYDSMPLAAPEPSAKQVHVVLKGVRLSFVSLLTRKANPSGKMVYSASIMIPNDAGGKETLARLRQAEKFAREIGIKKKWGGELPDPTKSVINVVGAKGDGPNAVTARNTVKKYPEYKDCLAFFNAANERHVPVVNRRREPVTTDEGVYSGVFANVALDLYPYLHAMGGAGVGAGLSSVQVTRLAEPFAGGTGDPDADFDELDEEEWGEDDDYDDVL